MVDGAVSVRVLERRRAVLEMVEQGVVVSREEDGGWVLFLPPGLDVRVVYRRLAGVSELVEALETLFGVVIPLPERCPVAKDGRHRWGVQARGEACFLCDRTRAAGALTASLMAAPSLTTAGKVRRAPRRDRGGRREEQMMFMEER